MQNRSLGMKWWTVAAMVVGVPLVAEMLRGETTTEVAASGKKGPAYAERKKVDPIAANGEIFVDWPKPDVALVFSGEQAGYIEPCGCAGLDNQKGGLRRRSTLIKQLRDKGWNPVPLDLGGQEKDTGVQAEIKVDFTYRALVQMGYAAVGFGPGELKLDLLPIVINLDQETNPIVSANCDLAGLNKPYKIVEVGGMRIGITSVLGKKEIAGRKQVGDVMLLEPYQAIPKILGELRAKQCDHLVLLSHAEPGETTDLARRFPEFNWVMTAKGAEEPPKEPSPIQGTNSLLVEVGQKAEYVIVVGLYKSGEKPFRYQKVPLDHRFPDAPEIQQMEVAYQQQLKALGFDGLGLKPVPHPSGGKFVGSAACADCHSQAFEVFENTPHVHATDTLLHLDPPRQFDPECLSCHVTGWEPQKYFPFESGYLSLQQTPNLVGNGCENCHGPAARHVAAENGDIEVTDAEMEKLRAALRLKVTETEGNKPGQVYKEGSVVSMCMNCHDLDNSPDFDFKTYWPKVKHVGKE
jgi:hypothetical protein